ncbi:MAG: hypothetical protein JST01_15670 [Cyanobacteria bacterium SZAS TMP-1]|nr:hypothetical protein [Cyanobacteria bacterium SZAS TMP-1]
MVYRKFAVLALLLSIGFWSASPLHAQGLGIGIGNGIVPGNVPGSENQVVEPPLLGTTPGTVPGTTNPSDVVFFNDAKIVTPLSSPANQEHVLTGIIHAGDRKELRAGAYLDVATDNDVICTPFGDVHIAAQSVVLIVCQKSALAVFDLHDGKKKAVFIENHGKVIPLDPGRAAIIANGSESDFAELNPAYFVPYRQLRMSSNELPELNVFRAEFNMMAMISGFPQLKSLANSPDPDKRKAIDNMLKTAVIMSQLGARSDQYIQYIPAAVQRQLNQKVK